MNKKAYLWDLQEVLIPFAEEYVFRTQNDLELLTMVVPISEGAWKVRLEVCVSEVDENLCVVEFYSTLQEGLTSVEPYAQAAEAWNRDSLGTYGIFRQDDTVALFHRHLNVMDTKQSMRGLVAVSKETFLVIIHELERRVSDLQELAAPEN